MGRRSYEIFCDSKYILFPASHYARNKRVCFYLDGELVYDLAIPLDYCEPDYTFPLSVERFFGRGIELTVEPEMELSIQKSESGVCAAEAYAGKLPELDFTRYSAFDCYFSYQLTDAAGAVLGQGSVLFCAPKHFHFTDPKLAVRVEDDMVVVTAGAYARSVELQCGADVLLEDNFFDMDGGERRVRILRGGAAQVSARSVFDIR